MESATTNGSSQFSVFDTATHHENKTGSIETYISLNQTHHSTVNGYDDNLTIFNNSTLIEIASTILPILEELGKGENKEETERHLDWTNLVLALGLCVLIVITVIGNTLVILSVLTTRRLRTVTNCFVMSLAVADWLVGIFVMPPAVALYLIGMLILYD